MEIEKAPTQEPSEVLRVLIADDNAPTRMLLRAAIKQWGYEVIEASDGEQAWDILQQPNPPRLLILDWLMPKLDGADLSIRIRHESTFHPYIILLTQVSGTENVIKGLEAGADEFLSKPFNMAELRSRLSVGARIIKNENALAKKNSELENYIAQMKKITDFVSEISNEIDSILAETNASKAEVISVQRDKIQDLHNRLELLTNTIQNF